MGRFNKQCTQHCSYLVFCFSLWRKSSCISLLLHDHSSIELTEVRSAALCRLNDNRSVWASNQYPQLWCSMVSGLDLSLTQGGKRWRTLQWYFHIPVWKVGCRRSSAAIQSDSPLLLQGSVMPFSLKPTVCFEVDEKANVKGANVVCGKMPFHCGSSPVLPCTAPRLLETPIIS